MNWNLQKIIIQNTSKEITIEVTSGSFFLTEREKALWSSKVRNFLWTSLSQKRAFNGEKTGVCVWKRDNSKTQRERDEFGVWHLKQNWRSVSTLWRHPSTGSPSVCAFVSEHDDWKLHIDHEELNWVDGFYTKIIDLRTLFLHRYIILLVSLRSCGRLYKCQRYLFQSDHWDGQRLLAGFFLTFSSISPVQHRVLLLFPS